MARARSYILTYHSLDTSGSVISIPPSIFRSHMECLSEAGIPVVPLQDLPNSPGAVAITFDDGFRNFREHAVPVLTGLKFPATVFVVSGFCGRDNWWPSQPKQGIPRLPLMGWGELRDLPRSLISVGGHTVTHPRLPELRAVEAARELRECRDALEQEIGQAVTSFAYPYGASSSILRIVVKCYFSVACGTSLGFVHPKSDCMYLPRIDAYYLRSGFPLARLLNLPGRLYVRLRQLPRSLRACLSP